MAPDFPTVSTRNTNVSASWLLLGSLPCWNRFIEASDRKSRQLLMTRSLSWKLTLIWKLLYVTLGKDVEEFEGDVCVLYIPLLILRQYDKTKNLKIAYLLISDIFCALGKPNNSYVNNLTGTLVIYESPPFLLWCHNGHWWPERFNFL